MPETTDNGAPATLGRREQDARSGAATPPAAAAFAPPHALYTGHNVHPAYALRYDWTGWPTAGTCLPPNASDLAHATAPAWEADGLHLLELRAHLDRIQMYNLHVVLVVAGRDRITNPAILTVMRDAVFATAETEGHRIAACALMPDHVHLSLRGNLERTPQEIALAFQNSLAHAAGCRVWQDSYYAGTFSEYDLDTVRRLAD